MGAGTGHSFEPQAKIAKLRGRRRAKRNSCKSNNIMVGSLLTLSPEMLGSTLWLSAMFTLEQINVGAVQLDLIL